MLLQFVSQLHFTLSTPPFSLGEKLQFTYLHFPSSCAVLRHQGTQRWSGPWAFVREVTAEAAIIPPRCRSSAVSVPCTVCCLRFWLVKLSPALPLGVLLSRLWVHEGSMAALGPFGIFLPSSPFSSPGIFSRAENEGRMKPLSFHLSYAPLSSPQIIRFP